MPQPLTYELLVDRAERPQKCTILPLEGRPDFAIRRFDVGRPIPPLTAALLLHRDGAPLDTMAAELTGLTSLAVIDCVWRRCDKIMSHIAGPLPRLARIPDGFVTAYPRRNKKDLDPADGLATIEAVFIAAAFCGVWDETLLEKYYWARPFLEANAAVFARYGVTPPKT